MAAEVLICEMSPRDGMQVLNRSTKIPLEERLELIALLQDAGFGYIEAGSFVSPKAVPAMADTAELLSALEERQGNNSAGEIAVLVPNLRHFLRMRSLPAVNTVALFVSASEAYSQKNVRMSVEEAMAAAREVAEAALAAEYGLRAHLSGAFRDLTDENRPNPEENVVPLVADLIGMGCDVVALADSDGNATREDIIRILRATRVEVALDRVGVHLHDRYGNGIRNACVAYAEGVRIFDAAVGGIGGNAASAYSAGNIATEELIHVFMQDGVETGIDLETVRKARRLICAMSDRVGDPPPRSRFL